MLPGNMPHYTMLYQNSAVPKHITDGRRLELSAAEIAHHGEYYCIAKNPAGFIRRDYGLKVLGKSLNRIYFVHTM